MSVIIRDSKGNPIIEIGEYMIMNPMINEKADTLVKLLNDFYDKEF